MATPPSRPEAADAAPPSDAERGLVLRADRYRFQPMLCDSYWRLADLLEGRRTVVLSGAGCSTESGIPDYRGPGSPARDRRPMRYREFVGDAGARARYWARSAVGWPRIAAAWPNAGHRALARLERAGLVGGIITQNVDGLHRAAGSRRVVDLHGDLARVRCLECGTRTARGALQRRLLELHLRTDATDAGVRPAPDRSARHERGAAPPRGHGRPSDVGPVLPDGDAPLPDGDAALEAATVPTGAVPSCTRCGGVLKPDVVFFGENVPRDRVERAWRLYEMADVLLVVGSSLAVYSGYRFVLRAARDGVPVGIVNLGPTRGDGEAAARVHGRSGEVLPLLAEDLLRPKRPVG